LLHAQNTWMSVSRTHRQWNPAEISPKNLIFVKYTTFRHQIKMQCNEPQYAVLSSELFYFGHKTLQRCDNITLKYLWCLQMKRQKVHSSDALTVICMDAEEPRDWRVHTVWCVVSEHHGLLNTCPSVLPTHQQQTTSVSSAMFKSKWIKCHSL